MDELGPYFGSYDYYKKEYAARTIGELQQLYASNRAAADDFMRDNPRVYVYALGKLKAIRELCEERGEPYEKTEQLRLAPNLPGI